MKKIDFYVSKSSTYKLYSVCVSLLCCFLLSFNSFSQKTIQEAIEKYNQHTVPYISIQALYELQKNEKSYTLLDTRPLEEYQVSHIKNAIWVGYKKFDEANLPKNITKTDTLVVYCSIGVRSEHIGEKLKKLGFKNVYNLYGGIFDWYNAGWPVYNHKENPTRQVHPYDDYWGKFITKEK